MPFNFEGTQKLLDDSELTKPLQSTMSEAVKANPDTHAKLMDLSQKTGLTPDLVAGDLPRVEQQDKMNQFDFSGVIERSPKTGAFLTDYDSAAIAHDDVDNLEQLEQALAPTGMELIKPGKNVFGNMFDNFFPRQRGQLLLSLQSLSLMSSNNTLKDQQRTLRASSNTSPGFTGNPVIQRQREAFQNLTPVEQEKLIQIGADFTARIAQTNVDITETIDDVGLTEALIEKLKPENLTPDQQDVLNGFDSAAQMFPSLATGIGASIITKNPIAGTAITLSMMGTQVRGPEYWRAIQGGLSHEEAATFSLIKSGLEVGTELLPVSSLIRLAKSTSGKKVLSFAIREMGGEQLNTLLGGVVDFEYGLDPEMEAAVAHSTEAIIDLQLERQRSTAISTVVAGGVQLGGVAAVSKTLSVLSADEQIEQIETDSEQDKIDSIVDVTEQSTVKERSSSSFKQFVESASPDGNIHIDGPQAALYLQEVEGDVQSDPVLSSIAEQVAEASQTNGEVIIPIADFATDIVGSEHFEALRPHMTLSSETISPFRQEAEREDRDNFIRSFIEIESNKAENTGSVQYVESQQIYDEVTEQLVRTGQVSKFLAKIQAQVLPQMLAVHAQDKGVNVKELYEQHGVTIEGPFEDRKTAIREGNEELGIILDQQDFGDVTFDEQHERESTGEKLTVKKSAQRAFEQKQKQRTMAEKLLDCVNG